jgi:hypothetical protein
VALTWALQLLGDAGWRLLRWVRGYVKVFDHPLVILAGESDGLGPKLMHVDTQSAVGRRLGLHDRLVDGDGHVRFLGRCALHSN